MSDSATPTTFEFDLRVVRLAAIKKAAYRLSARYTADIRQNSEYLVQVTLRARNAALPADPLLADFPTEVLDQDLREVVAEETKQVRDLLLAQAFSAMSVIDPLGESGDYHADPLHIGQTRRDSQ